jgi:putative endonuclease
MTRGGSVYIMTNKTHSVLYIGVTAEIISRIYDHKTKRYPNSFTAKYNCNKLVYYFSYPTIEEAIAAEKYLKGKVRQYKINVINEFNPTWRDLYDELVNE